MACWGRSGWTMPNCWKNGLYSKGRSRHPCMVSIGMEIDALRCSRSRGTTTLPKVCVCVIAMRQVYEEIEFHSANLVGYTSPPLVAVAKNGYAKNEIIMSAASQRIDSKSTAGSFCLGNFMVGGTETDMHISPQICTPTGNDGSENKCPWLCAFWVVAANSTDVVEEGNMALMPQVVKVGGCNVSVPTFTNYRKVRSGETLRWCKMASAHGKRKRE